MAGATDYFFVATQSGDYNVVCTDQNGCEVEAVIFNVLAGISLPVNNLNEDILFPNPVTGKMSVVKPGKAIDNVTVRNIHGEKILVIGSVTNGIIDCTQLPPGMYLLEYDSSMKHCHRRFTKQ